MSTERPLMPSLAEALRYWFTLGFISFGGPAGQIAMMHTELVERRRWISEQRFLHALNYCMLLPGPEAIQLAMYLSWLMHGTLGAILAGVFFLLPAFLIMTVLAALYLAFGDLPLIQGIFDGIKPAVVAIVAFAAWRIGVRTLHNGWLIAIAALAFFAIFFLRIDFPWIVLGAALLGILGGALLPKHFQHPTYHTGAIHQSGTAAIDDSSPLPAHAHFRWHRLIFISVIFIALWSAVLLALDNTPVLAAMGAFFTKAAFLTFGGAYAVLPYVYQAGVEQFQWITATQMIDGLALGETTPGPLIKIVTWIGYIGGVGDGLFANPLLGGLAGASVATFFTFLPSFWFILAGAPLVEATRHELRLIAPLTAITAAVVGVIANLAVFFAWHSFWPNASAADPFAGNFQWLQLGIALFAFLALWHFKQSVIRVILVCAALGALISFL